jgi:hypothetical protein
MLKTRRKRQKTRKHLATTAKQAKVLEKRQKKVVGARAIET